MKQKWLWGISLIGSLLVILGVFGYVQQRQQTRSIYNYTTTPTVFVHGWRGSAYSSNQMIAAIESAHVGRKRLTVTVSPSGQFSYSGYWSNRRKNPLIQVIFTGNRAGEVQYEKWLTILMQQLKKRYGIKTVNIVGHSMGAYAATYYAMNHGNQADVPRLKKLVTIAGPFDGIVGHTEKFHPRDGTTWTDRPNVNHFLEGGQPLIIHPEYLRLERLANHFPKQTKVLNIYGDLKDGSHSDKVVTVVSATSLAHLIKARAASYQTKRVTGPQAEHSRLHEDNPVVDQALLKFLWGKSN
ncbi:MULTISPECIES: alpha/beta fold hydrolase [Loigolactobacillus]|uniref:Uncharacterized protein n=1 Tax=Loigolactobacillus backii TaxID=375175 RepID=A0A192H004_9LACO|nr:MULTISPECIES: alpha/beta fold hydrolase [Loigolactobacillus]ANK60745.1 hypothetical protein AYR52_11080 [Loigolactobacillus backii]ANK61685.1 hypothetical protein AYR53_02235 [Loigolactobacillus backii]ANK65698.1 hypothetical protein AYR54_10880 [Loigolactobacillus backii]ANK68175.1 hypothetical protein AYR55_11035 [Loigolactobacillus backii]ANK69117.1 hypothetical protein AYR56_02475 [Loigolactobacillus backii]